MNEKKIIVGENTLELGEDNIYYITTVGEIDEKIATTVKEKWLMFLQEIEVKLNLLIDMNKAGKSSSAARKIWKELSEHEKVEKIAFHGMHPVARMLASFVMGGSRNNAMRFFKKKEEAIKWLKE